MKKLLVTLLAISVSVCSAFAFTACDLDDLFGNNNGGNTENGTTAGNGSSDNKDEPPAPDCGFWGQVSVTGIDDLFYEPLETLYESGTEVEIKLDVITDVSLYVFVNGERVEQSHYDSDYWGYKFTMPYDDVVIHITTNEYYGVEICDFDKPFFWAKYLKSDDIVKIKRETDFNNPNLATSPEVIYTTDKTDIENICAVFNSKLKPCANPQITGGSSVTYTFYTADAEYELLISGGYAVSISFSTADWFKIIDFTFPVISNPEI